MMERLNRDKHCSLSRTSVNYGRKKFYSTAPGCWTYYIGVKDHTNKGTLKRVTLPVGEVASYRSRDGSSKRNEGANPTKLKLQVTSRKVTIYNDSLT
jgi:hypothetical protein